MKTNELTYLAMDVHARFCVIGSMDADGHFLGSKSLDTCEKEILTAVSKMPRPNKLVLEEGAISRWIAQLIQPVVDEVYLCDPRHNKLISHSARKNDSLDTEKLCKLLRLGEIKALWIPTDDARTAFKSCVQQYLDITRELTRFKLRIKARFQGCGIMEVTGERVWTVDQRRPFLDRLPRGPVRQHMERNYIMLDALEGTQDSCLRDMQEQGRRFPEIARFQEMPGAGPVTSHVFSGFIQTPERFANKRKVLRYCGFGITDRSSAGKSLGHQRLDRSGCRPLKAASFAIYRGAMKANDNAIKQYYNLVLDRTRNATHARLSTQRKIITTLYTIWKGNCHFDPHRFLHADND